MPVQLPNDLMAGNWFVMLVVDAGSVVSESDEENNVKTASSILQIDPSAAYKPDLVVDDLIVPSGGSLSQNDKLNYQLVIRNIGQSEAKSFKFAAFLSTDKVLDPEDLKITDDNKTTIFSLDPDAQRSFVKAYTIPEDVPDGDYYLIAHVDHTNAVSEADEFNNKAVANPVVAIRYVEPQGVDLEVIEWKALTTIVYIGGHIGTRLKVRNLGTQDVNSFTYNFFLSKDPYLNPNTDFDLGARNGPKLAAKAEVVLEDLVKLNEGLIYEEGTYYLSVFIDRNNLITELNDGNNSDTDSAGIAVTNEMNVDLEAIDVDFHPVSAPAGGEVTISHSIKNNGSTNSGGFFSAIVFSPDPSLSAAGVAAGADFLVAKIPVGGVGPGVTEDLVNKIVVPNALPHDISDYYVGVIVDYGDAVTGELDNNNNQVVTDYTLAVSEPQGGCFEDDFEANDDQASAAEITEGEHTGLGLCGAEDWFELFVPQGNTLTVELLLSSPLYLEPRPFDLDLQVLGGTSGLDKTSEMIGDYEKVVVLSAANDETVYLRVYPKEDGNEAQYDLLVNVSAPEDGVDLIVDRVFVQPKSIYPGGVVQITTELYNVGNVASPTFDVNYFLSEDPLLDDADLPMGGVQDLQIGALGWHIADEKHVLPVTSGGSYYVLAKVDAGEAVTEVSETNNIGVSDVISLDDTLVCEQDSFEPNDAAISAAEMATASGIYANLYVCPDLEDWYSFDLSLGQAFAVTVNYSYEASKGAVRIELYDETRTAIVDASSDPNNPFVGIPSVYYEGPYYLRIYVQAPPTGDSEPYPYTMGVSLSMAPEASVCEPDPDEFNNSFELSSTIGCGPSTHTLCSKDVDVYHLEVELGQSLSASLNHADDALKMGVYFEPGEAPGDVTQGNGSVSVSPGPARDVWLIIEPVSPFANLQTYAYDLFVDGISGTDLTISVDEVFPVEAVQDEDVQLSLTLSNQCVDAADALGYRVFVSQDALVDDADVLIYEGSLDGLAGKSSELVEVKASIPPDLAPGEAWIVAEVDSEHLIHESNEWNNEDASPVTIASSCEDDPFEPNDGAEMAATIQAGLYPGLMLCKNDYDWYRVKAEADSLLSVDLLHDDDGDLDMRLYTATNLAQYLAAGTETEDGESLEYLATNGGWYYLRVAGFNEAQNEYELQVEIK